MTIIIPMAGSGNRFIQEGYIDPKPLIQVDGLPIIERIVKNYPVSSNFIFICNEDHEKRFKIKKFLTGLVKSCHVSIIPCHKLGPVHTVLQIENLIDHEDEIIIQYCDVSVYWNFSDFLYHTRSRNSDSAMVCHKGFHPHMLGTTNYAFMRDNGKQWMKQIQEKKPYTENRMNEYASAGIHYFKSSKQMFYFFKLLKERNININGEYYVSLIHNLLEESNLTTSIYEIQHMLQWGTPFDVENFNTWASYFRNIINYQYTNHIDANILIPAAGRGSRFSDFQIPKPFIEVNGKQMVVQATNCLSCKNKYTFVTQKEQVVHSRIHDYFPSANIVVLNEITEGQACTCERGIIEGNLDLDRPLLIGCCDMLCTYNQDQWDKIIDHEPDCVVWATRNNPSSRINPYSYSWLKMDSGNISKVSVKKPVSSTPQRDLAVIGVFYFRKANFFIEALSSLYDNDIRINNEFYIDSLVNEMISSGKNVKAFSVNSFISLGSSDDLRCYEYWQSFFHKYCLHPYDIDMDLMVTSNYRNRFKKCCEFSNNKFYGDKHDIYST